LNKNREALEVLGRLRRLANPLNVQGMARYGIRPARPLGISVQTLRGIAQEIGTDHDLALRLWKSGIHEARILATIIEDPERVTEFQMERWVKGFDSWDICDQACANCFEKTEFAWRKCREWTTRKEEFVVRAAFSLMARLAVSDKEAADSKFHGFFPLIRKGARDERNFVSKAVEWALRQIGKRSPALNRKAVGIAKQLAKSGSPAASRVARKVLKELTSPATLRRISRDGS
jgi:3-methyladenine DNA glycosylase AlkD